MHLKATIPTSTTIKESLLHKLLLHWPYILFWELYTMSSGELINKQESKPKLNKSQRVPREKSNRDKKTQPREYVHIL